MKSNAVVLPVPDLDGALAFFVETLGFRVDRIWPADNPRVAQISLVDAEQTVHIELRVNGDPAPLPEALPPLTPTFEISRLRDAGWGVGRAGMRYRDLLPTRQGGHFIASHIHIPGSGPVPDWVHFHEVQFQMIFCYRGRARVVYEDQGPPFDLVAGDCVLQPPTIRHRVLESSDDLQVIEIGGPAAHVTAADHDLSLPTALIAKDRRFGGQLFVHSQASAAIWRREGDLAFRDLGFRAATDGYADASLIRGKGLIELHNPEGLLFLFVLEGSIELDGERLGVGDSVSIPAYGEVVCDGEILRVAVCSGRREEHVSR